MMDRNKKKIIRRLIVWGVVLAALAALVYGLYEYQPGIEEVITWLELAIMGVAVFAFGFLIMLFCTLISVNKFLRMSAGELYKI